ncbi:MAG: amidohydrolase family protein [Clostridia bacterium]|nr:amidohydrolase family protein [Clostridia bacterium]
MKIYDMHIHIEGNNPQPEFLLARLQKAGVYGGCVFSDCPHLGKNDGSLFDEGGTFKERLESVLNWTKGYEGRLFPVLWIHPDEENVFENIKVAADAGICAFKIICNDFFVYEDKSIRLLEEIAKLGKPVIFHSGILWDGGVSSVYNRPLHWEVVMNIKGLRFSLGHCSWPWVDECISLYGKFLNSLAQHDTAEMFFDITPGTPEIYRKELLTKLYTIGYDMGHNIMFGTDCSANTYSADWCKNWLDIDSKIMLELGVSKENFENLYSENLMRFLGISTEPITHISPATDDAGGWTALCPKTKTIIEKWYKKLGFDKEFDAEFYEALETIPVSDAVTVDNCDISSKDGKRNLLSFLFMCEEVAAEYRAKGISEDILLDTLGDIVRWCRIWSEIKGELYLGETEFLAWHMKLKLFKLGRLQFAMKKAEEDIPSLNIKKGDALVDVHIPAAGSLDKKVCQVSFALAREFFEKFFPEHKFNYFTCDSWLLDDGLKKLLPRSSNIVAFGNMFKKVSKRPSDSVLHYVFRWDIKRYQMPGCACNTSFAKKLQKAVKEGKTFYQTLGFIKK